MAQGSQNACLLACVTLLATLAPSLAGEWCEDFESGPGRFWTQPDSQGGSWLHTGYANETKQGHHVPRPPTGEDGILLLRPYSHRIVVWSMLVSPELQFYDDATIELDYWLWFNRSQPRAPVSFMLFRRHNGAEDEEAFLNISSYASVHQSHWASIEAGLPLDKGNTMQIAIYGYLAGDGPVMSSDLGLDRITLRGVHGSNPCGGNSSIPTLPPPEPTTPVTAPTTSLPTGPTNPTGPTDPTNPTNPTGPTTPHHDFFCPAAYGLFRDPFDCHWFYECGDWLAYHMVCPADLVYNESTYRCDYRRNVPECR